MVNPNDLLACTAGVAASVTVTDTLPAKLTVGVPLMTPVDGLMDRPAGRPGAIQEYGCVPPAAVTGAL